MNRSSKGFGLVSVFCVVVFMIVTAVFSASANSATMDKTQQQILNLD